MFRALMLANDTDVSGWKGEVVRGIDYAGSFLVILIFAVVFGSAALRLINYFRNKNQGTEGERGKRSSEE